jgi:hypothetical protein
MKRYYIIILLIFVFNTVSEQYGISRGKIFQIIDFEDQKDTIKENQILYNGRIWRNLFYTVQGDQFLFSKEFLEGSISISRQTFPNLLIKYDLFKDEILTPSDTGGILQINKELVDSFSISYLNTTYKFIKMREDTLKEAKRYFNVLYKGRTALYLEYGKKIEKLAVEGKYDRFYEIDHIYFEKGNILYPVTGKRDLMKILYNYETPLKNFIKKNKLNVTERIPESFVPVIRYYDSISQ